jgi:arsenite methyltransferase
MQDKEGSAMQDKEDIREFIRRNYAEVAAKGVEGDCCSAGCCCSGAVADTRDTALKLGYAEADLSQVPPEANLGLGCGNPVAIASLKKGETVLDLGCGGGFDCFLARERVGKTGRVIGVDMTPDMIRLARKNADKSGYTNIEFRLGEIEHLPVADASVDVIISNCVINLSRDKEQVFKEAFRVLKHGGRLAISDVLATVPLPEAMKKDPALIASCIGGAESGETIRRLLRQAGFAQIRLTPKDNSSEIVSSWAPGQNVADYVASYLIEAVKAGDQVTKGSCCSPAGAGGNCCCS